jgi:myo-inositol 2-dehydrogenase / D-chiro-inositol 1-dehydrogenase
VIGCGRIAGLRHLPALAALPNARVVAVADVHAERLAGIADRFGIERRYGSHEELLADAEIEAVAVLVPAALHAEVAIAALDAAKHVLVEKPLALDLSDADRLVERAAASDRQVLVAYNLRWHRLVREARRLLAGGAIGEPELLASSFTSPYAYRTEAKPWRRARETGGGVLVEMASHHYDLWRYLLRDDPVEVSALVRDGDEEDEAATVQVRMRGGTLVTGLFSQRSLEHQDLEVFGTEGHLRLGVYRFDALEVTRHPRRVGDARGRLDGAARLVRSLPAAAAEARAGGLFVASYRDEWRHFLAVCRGEVEPECTAEDGRRSLALLLAAAESASCGRSVALDEAPARLAR